MRLLLKSILCALSLVGLARTQEKRTLVVVTHDKNVADYGGRTIHLRDGRTE